MTDHTSGRPAFGFVDPPAELNRGDLLHLLAERLQASGNYLSAAQHLRRTSANGAAADAALKKAEGELRCADETYRLLRERLKTAD